MIVCPKCGAQLADGTTACNNCSASVVTLSEQTAASPPVYEGLKPDADGRYNWYYELNMFTNPTVFITLMKIFGGIILGMGVFLALLMIGDGFAETMIFMLKFWLYGFAGAFVLVGLSYCIHAAIQGGKYCVLFEMDEKSVIHTQLAKQFKKAQVIAALTMVMGMAKGSPGMVGTGILAGSRSSMETKFKFVNKVKVKRRRHVIYLHAAFSWNQIYVRSEDFDTVLEHILASIPPTAKIRGIKQKETSK